MADSALSNLKMDMQILTQQAVIAVFARLMRIRIATQGTHQRAMSLAILENEFAEALSSHESQILVDEKLTERGILFRDTFQSMSDGLMKEVASGLTESEELQFKRELG